MVAPQGCEGVSGSVLGDAACLAAVVGSTSSEVLAVSVVDVPGGVIAVEVNGFQGSLPEVIQRLSVGGATASMFWNVNDDNAFSCGRDGEIGRHR
jgi:hypothetical protein